MRSSDGQTMASGYFEVFWNGGKLGAMEELLAQEAVLHDPVADVPVPIGKIAEKLAAAERSAFPDLEFRVEEVVSEGDKTAVRWTAHGTHEGVYMGVKGRGTAWQTSGMIMFRFADGKIDEMWLNMDDLGLRQQLGIVQD